MKKVIILIMMIGIGASSFSQTNYPVFSIEETINLCFVDNSTQLYSVETSGDKTRLVSRNTSDGSVIKVFKTTLPDNPVSHMAYHDETKSLLLVTMKQEVDNGKSLLDEILRFDPINDKMELLFSSKESMEMPYSIRAVGNYLVLMPSGLGKKPTLFNVNTGLMEKFTDDKQVHLLAACPSHNGFIVAKISDPSKDVVPVFFMGLDRKLSHQIGDYSAKMVISSDEAENTLPHFIISDHQFDWVPWAYNISSFPLSGFEIATRAQLAEKYNQLDQLYNISTIVTANDNFIVVKAKGKLLVYNIKEPVTTKPQTVSNKDLSAISDFVKSKTTYDMQPITSGSLDVFNARFYLITGKTALDENSSTEETIIVFTHNGSYDILKDPGQLTLLVFPSFKLNSIMKATQFQDALNALYPPGTFERKHIAFRQYESGWQFVRDKSFDEEKGYVVATNKDGLIEQISYSENLE